MTLKNNLVQVMFASDVMDAAKRNKGNPEIAFLLCLVRLVKIDLLLPLPGNCQSEHSHTHSRFEVPL